MIHYYPYIINHCNARAPSH